MSTFGVTPACRTLDCVSIFALNCADAQRVLNVAQGFDTRDAWSRPAGQSRAWPTSGFRFGVPSPQMLEFFGDDEAAHLYEASARHLERMGGLRCEFNFQPFADAAALLYAGPWVAERYAAICELAETRPEALHPITARVILSARGLSAVSAFEARYRLAELARACEAEWAKMDFALLPTTGTCYTHEQIAAEPITLNTNLGYYTNFVNLLDLAAVAVPAGQRANGMPFGVTAMAPAWSDLALLGMADRIHREYSNAVIPVEPPYCPVGYVPVAVCGAHLSGQPLNYQLTQRGAFLLEITRTSPRYRFYALKGTTPRKPGLARAEMGGAPIDVEVWAVPEDRFGSFTAEVPAPLGIGNCELESGRTVKSFICEPWALADAEEITSLGGWRQWLASTR